MFSYEVRSCTVLYFSVFFSSKWHRIKVQGLRINHIIFTIILTLPPLSTYPHYYL